MENKAVHHGCMHTRFPHWNRLMADRYHLYPLTGAGSLKVEGLAKRVIDDLGRSSPAESRKRVVETTIWLANISITNATYEQDDVLRALMKRGLTRDLIVDCCIPDAARLLGDGWMENLRTFGQVSLGTARLQALLKALTVRREAILSNHELGSLLVLACEGEDHTLGALVFTDQLRRRGYSVNVLLGARIAEIQSLITKGDFDTILLSSSSETAFETVAKKINYLRHKNSSLPPLVIGGGIVDILGRKIHQRVDVDLVSNDLGQVLDFISPHHLNDNNNERAS